MRYVVEGPDGKRYIVEGPDAGAAPEPVQRPMQHTTSSSSEDPGAPEQIGRGLGYSLQKASAGLTGMLPRPLEQAIVSAGLSPSQEQLTSGKKFVDEQGGAALGGQMFGDVVSQVLPTKKLSMMTEGARGLPKAVANIAGLGGINAALTPTDRGAAAAIGSGSGVLGNTMARLMGGPVRTAITPEAKTLMAEGIPLTPGQMISGKNATVLPRFFRAAEDKIQSAPVIGDIIKERVRQSALGFNTQKINEAVKPLGIKIEGFGDDALEEALSKISNAYENVLPSISVPHAKVMDSMRLGMNQVDQEVPLLAGPQEASLQKFIDKRVLPYHNGGAGLTGKEAQAMDSELGENIRKFARGSPMDRELSKAFGILRDSLRDSMEGTTPEAKVALHSARTARAKLEPIKQLIQGSKTETFSPAGLRDKIYKKDERPDAVTRAAMRVLPSKEPDSGTAGRTLLNQWIANNGASAGAGAAGTVGTTGMLGAMSPYLLGGAAALGMYTKPGAAYMAQGVHPLIKMLRKGKGYDMDALEEYVRQITAAPVRAGFNTNLGE